MRLRASKWKAKQKIQEMEEEAEEEDAETMAGDDGNKIESRKLVRRQVEWDPILNFVLE